MSVAIHAINLLTVLAGAFAGVLFALYINQRWSETRRKKRERTLVKFFKKTLEKNERLLSPYSESPVRLAEDYDAVPDITVFESTMSFKYEIIRDLELNTTLDSIFHKLRALSLLMGICIENPHGKEIIYAQRDIRRVLEKALEEIDSAKTMIDGKFPQLE